MAKLIITVEGGKVTQTLNFLDRNVKDNRYVYGNGNESGIVDDPAKIYADIPENYRITECYEELREAVKIIPLDRILVETDAPYLTPRNVPGLERTNVPGNIVHVVRELAKYMKVREEELIWHARENTERIFSLDREAGG